MSSNIKKRSFPAQVASVETNKTIVINRGSNDGVHNGEYYLVYRLGKEIIDPETQESLGLLENVIGKGKIIHTQETMATLESADYEIINSSKKTVTEEENNLTRMFGIGSGKLKKTTYTEPEKKQIPFKDVCIGDYVKPI